MNLNAWPPIVLALIAGIGYGLWPTVANKTGVNAAWMSTVVTGVSALVMIGFYFRNMGTTPSYKVVGVLVACGVVLGFATIAYVAIFTHPLAEMSVHVPIALILTQVVVVVGARAAFGDPITVPKMFGFAFFIAGIWLVTRPSPPPRPTPVAEEGP